MYCSRCGGGFEEKEKIVNSGKILREDIKNYQNSKFISLFLSN